MFIINKKRSVLFITIILIVVFVFSCFSNFFGVFGGNEKYVVKRGKSDYKIVVPNVAEASEKNAARELQIFFEEATGIRLPIVTDGEYGDAASESMCFSIGKTNFLPKSVESSLKGLKSCGYVIKTVDNTIYLVGPSSHGTLYAVYGYLSREFGFEYYFTDIYSLNKDVGDLELKNYDESVNPDINMMSMPSVGFIQNNSLNKLRFNALSTADCFIPANGTTETHNLFKFMPPSLYDEHQQWFSDNKATGCFTAHGDEKEYQAMQEYFLNVIKDGMKKSSTEIFQISPPDNSGFCACTSCNEKGRMYGGSSGIMVKFCNDLSKKVLDWFKTDDGKPYERDFKLVFLAYQNIANAPEGDICCDDNVGVYLAFDSFRSSYGLHEDNWNESLYQTVIGWSKKTHNILFWLYDVNFNYYFYPYDTSAYKQDFYKLMKDVGTIMVNDLSQHQNTENTTAWNNVKSYISCKLRWDVNANVEELTRKFFKNCYKDAWEIMYNVYSEYKAHWAVLKYKVKNGVISDDKNNLRSIFGGLNEKEFWSLTLLESWVVQFKEAIKAIEYLKETDKTTYDKVYKMICGEIISPMCMILDMYRSEFSTKELLDFAEEFKYYVTASGVAYYCDGSGSSISELYSQLGI